MQVTVHDLAVLVQGRIVGDADRLIAAARPMSDAGPDDVTFVENERNARLLATCRAAAVVVPAALAASLPETAGDAAQRFTFIEVKDALAAFVAVMQHLHGRPEPPRHGVDPRACVDPSAAVGPDPSIFPFAIVGADSVIGARCRLHAGAVVGRNCRLGDDVVLYPHVVLYDDTIIGDRVIIHANAVIGADGFGYRVQEGRHVKTPQFGHVEIGDDVEIGACTTIDRGTFQATRIGAGTKIDNLVQIGHNCRIGRHNLIVSQVGVAGSSSTGDYVVMGGQVGITDHVHIGDGAQLGAKTGVVGNVAAGSRMFGYPARPAREQKRIMATLHYLPEMCRDVRRIKRQLGVTDEG